MLQTVGLYMPGATSHRRCRNKLVNAHWHPHTHTYIYTHTHMHFQLGCARIGHNALKAEGGVYIYINNKYIYICMYIYICLPVSSMSGESWSAHYLASAHAAEDRRTCGTSVRSQLNKKNHPIPRDSHKDPKYQSPYAKQCAYSSR